MGVLRQAEGAGRGDLQLFTNYVCLYHDSVEDTTPECPCALDNSLVDMPTGLSTGWGVSNRHYSLQKEGLSTPILVTYRFREICTLP